jgi:hypothetical protein
VAVHEATHLDWFYRPEVSKDPRLLLTLPNERNANAVMADFLEGLLQAQEPEVAAYVAQHSAEIERRLSELRSIVALANERLGLPRDDDAEYVQLPEAIADEVLRKDLSPPAPASL